MNKFHRFLSWVLCLVFLFSFVFSPIRASAITVSPDPYASTAYTVVGGVVVEGFKEGSKLIASAILSVWNTVVTPEFLQTCQGVLEVGAFFTSPTAYRGIYDSFSDGEKAAGQMVLSKAFLSSVAAAYKTKTGQTLTVPDEDVTIHVPPQSVWSEAELITSDRLNYRGFSDLTEVNQNILAGNQIVWQLKKDLNGLELYLRTDFVEALTTEISDVTSKLSSIQSHLLSLWSLINTSFDDVELSIDTMSSSLSKDLKDLKTLYSSFGNETLSKLDTLNKSIQALDSSSLSADFLDLYNLIAQNDALTITALQNLPGQISDSISSFFETQSLQLEAISDKLGAESSYLLDLVGDMQLLRDEVVSGFADTVVALDQLDVAADINLQPLIDQVLDTEATLVGQFDSLYSLINNNIVAYTASNNELLSSLKGFVDSSNDSLLSLVDQVSYTLDDSLSTVIGFDILISDQLSSLSVLTDSISGQLADIKTSLQSIAGTTVANPPVHSSDLDELDKLEVPLYGAIGSGFDKGDEFFGFTLVSLDDELYGFLVAAKIFNEFADLSFFKKLIIASASIGFVCSLLGMGLDATGAFSSAYRRRESSAQAKSRERFEGGLVVQ